MWLQGHLLTFRKEIEIDSSIQVATFSAIVPGVQTYRYNHIAGLVPYLFIV